MSRQDCIAMLLAGGQGSRLGYLTKDLAKPAVPFGGKYRIIDFALSNCFNSGIETVGVLTQYKPLELNSYIGIGSAWDLDRKHGGVFILPPYVKEQGGQWYKGTADAIYQNIHFVDSLDPEYVLILSGDHIYKMDYAKMLDYHKDKQADATIAVIAVPWAEASRFGIMDTDENRRITEFAEKPARPRSNLASMGVYIFSWQRLKQYLLDDNQTAGSSHDFGKDIIPKMLSDGLNMFAYPFEGYWKDVGTVESFWEANMDLLAENPELNIYDANWRIYSVNPTRPPHYFGQAAVVKSSIVSEGCIVYGGVERSVLFPDVYIAPGAVVTSSIIMPGARIEAGARVDKAVIGSFAVLGEGSRIYGRESAEGLRITVVGDRSVVPAGVNVDSSVALEK